MKKLLALALVLAMTASMAACAQSGNPAGNESKASESKGGSQELVEVTIPTYRAGENVGAVFFLPQVERFNKKYEGQYKINIEESPSDTHNDKIKQLAQSNKLPAMVQMSDFVWIENYIIKNKKYYDLKEFLDGKPDVKNVMIPESIAYNTQDDGSVATLPLTVVRPMGTFYNSDLFKPSKPLTEMTWEELKTELGDNKVAFQTAEAGWTIQLWLCAMMATKDGGPEILNNGVEEKLTDFNLPQWKEVFGELKAWYDSNGWTGGIGANYPDAANSFFSAQTALIPNGPWMTGDFAADKSENWSNGFDGAKVTADMFPGNVALANTKVYDWFIPEAATDGEKQLGLAFFEFISTPAEIEAYMLAEGGSAPKLTYSEDYKTKLAEDKLKSEMSEAVNGDTIMVPGLSDCIAASTGEALSTLLPGLLDGTMTVDDFCQQLTDKAKEAAE